MKGKDCRSFLDILSRIIYGIERDISRLLSFFLYRGSSRLSSLAVDGLELDICFKLANDILQHTTLDLSSVSRNEELIGTYRR
jgi:hypothetical protein